VYSQGVPTASAIDNSEFQKSPYDHAVYTSSMLDNAGKYYLTFIIVIAADDEASV
jgi:hypothetical protein